MSELDLTFSVDEDQLGKIVTHELHSGGRARPVTNDNKYGCICRHSSNSMDDFFLFYSITPNLFAHFSIESTTFIIWHIFGCIHKFVIKQQRLSVDSVAL